MYNYVNPEDCKCECHELSAREKDQKHWDQPRDTENDKWKNDEKQTEVDETAMQEDELPLLDDDQGDESEKTPANIDKIKLDVTILDRRSIVRYVQ